MKIQSVLALLLLSTSVASKALGENMEENDKDTSISNYLEARVSEHADAIKKEFTNRIDLENYRSMVRKELAEDLGIADFLSRSSRPTVEKVYKKDLINDCVIERIDYLLDWNFYIPCHVWRPAEIEGKLPAVLLFTGGGKADYNINMMMQKWASTGIIVIQPDYPLTEELRDPYIGAETAGYNAGLPLIGLGVLELIRGVDYLSARPDVDPNRIALVGLNRAAIEVALAAALDDRVQAVALQDLTSYEAWAQNMGEQAVISLLNTPRHVVPGILKYADLPQVCATIAPRSLAIFGHSENSAYPQAGYGIIHFAQALSLR